MSTWVIMIATEVVIVAVSILAVCLWAFRGEGDDKMDKRLKELSEMNIENVKK